MKDEVLEILKGVNSEIDYENETALVDDDLLDSFEIVSIIGDLSDTFDVSITVDDMTPENFNSVDAICELIERLQEEQA
jgi:D-alanine--poly(phosphoribitol) ligase subunit 2